MSKYRHLFSLIIIAITLGIAQTTIAIIDFDSRGISANEVATLTDRFRDELTKTNQYIVVERGKMEEVLKEQGFQQSGCTSDECVVEVGQLIGVQQMVGGSIGKVGTVFTVSVRIIDVESGKILNATNYDHIGNIGILLTSGMHNAVQQLLESKRNRPSLVEREVLKSNEFTTPPAFKQTGTVTDIDGNTYQTVYIGNQWWMAENLKVTHYQNGEAIPSITDATEWSNRTDGAYCNYKNDATNTDTYGKLFNWYSVNDRRKIAPEGWHVPTDDEWRTLIDYLGGASVAGGKMKETGTIHWKSPNTGATNESGFTALPGGIRNDQGDFYSLGSTASLWSSTGSISGNAWIRYPQYSNPEVRQYRGSKRYGSSVRCVRD